MERLNHIENALAWGALQLKAIRYKSFPRMNFIEGEFEYKPAVNEQLSSKEYFLRLAQEAANTVFGEVRAEGGQRSLHVAFQHEKEEVVRRLTNAVPGEIPYSANMVFGDLRYVLAVDRNKRSIRIVATSDKALTEEVMREARKLAGKAKFEESEWKPSL